MRRALALACSSLIGPSTLVACVGPALPGPEVMVAGWDFSQYFGDTLLSVDGVGYANVLDSNYSDFVPLHPGPAALPFGKMYLDAAFGSTDTPLDVTNDPFVPFAGSLRSNLDAPRGFRFDCFPVLAKEGQTFANPLTMTARARATVVFEADLRSAHQLGGDWSIHFAGRTSAGSTPVGVEFSPDGADFERVGSVELTETDSPFRVRLGSTRSDRAYVRLTLEPRPETTRHPQAFLDNVAIRAKLALPPGATQPPRVERPASERDCR